MSSTWWKDENELILEQTKILDLPPEENILIKGPPGSGKTNLLLLRANYLYLGDLPNLNIVVFGSLLRTFIQLGGAQYKFPLHKIVTHAKLFSDILRENDAAIDTKNMKLVEARAARVARMEQLIDSGKIGEIYDALLLDEAQDYTPAEIRVFRALTKVLVATSDVRQKVYSVEDCSETLQNCVDHTKELKYHFRNGIEICRLADGLMKGVPSHTPLVTYSSYKEEEYKSTVTPRASLSIEARAEAIVEQVTAQRVAYPNDLIAVLCPRNEEVYALAEQIISTPIGSETTVCNADSFDPEKHVWLTTITGAKGLEFRAVHLAGLDFLSRTGGAQKRLAFTGVTRAKTALSLYWDSSIPGYLESAVRAVAPAKKTITKSNIFGKD